jgi:catechol 2,3-dioxygenase-like lactoylglutathione lyase family enzyme
MFARIKHIAIVTDDCQRLGAFYESVFKLRREASEEGRRFRSAHRAVVVTDGYVGLNFNFRKPGRPASLDHFGIEVEDVEEVFRRLRANYSDIEYLQRPGSRAFAGISTHDPAGNVFDLSHADMGNRASVYKEKTDWEPTRRIHHLTLRVMQPEAIACFYRKVFEFEDLPSKNGSFHLTDGKVTLVVAPWKISYFNGTGIERPKLDHIGFAVESREALQNDLETLALATPPLSPRAIADGPEGEARLRLCSECEYGRHHFADPDGTLLDITESDPR